MPEADNHKCRFIKLFNGILPVVFAGGLWYNHPAKSGSGGVKGK